MLTSDLLRVKRSKGQISPRFVSKKIAARLLPNVQQLVNAVGASVGQRRELLDEALDAIAVKPADRIVVQGLRKLLLDRCEFSCASGIEPDVLRWETFLHAAATRRELGPKEVFERTAVLSAIAEKLELTSEDLEDRLFADLKQNEVLLSTRSIEAPALLDRYNVALAQGVLLRATRVTVVLHQETPGNVRQLFRAARFHSLLHRVMDLGEGRIVIELDGPFSLFSAVQKYGLKLALFLPAVLRCKRWRLRADVLWGKKKEALTLELGPDDGLVPYDRRVTGVAPELHKFAEGFAQLDTAWTLEANDEILHIPGDVVCVPDFRFTHGETGEVVYLEAFGFWSRQAVWQRVESIQKGLPSGRLILAIGKQLRVSEEVLSEEDAAELYVYKSSMRPKAVLERLNAFE